VFLEFWLLVSFIYEKYHPIVFSVSDDSSQSLIDCPYGSHEIPLLSSEYVDLVYRLTSDCVKVSFLFYNKRIFDAGVGNSHHNDCSAKFIWKVDSLAQSSSANHAHQCSLWPYSSLFKYLDIVYAVFLFKHDMLVFLKFVSFG